MFHPPQNQHQIHLITNMSPVPIWKVLLSPLAFFWSAAAFSTLRIRLYVLPIEYIYSLKSIIDPQRYHAKYYWWSRTISTNRKTLLKEGKLKTTYHPTILPPWLSLRLFWPSSFLSIDRGPREQTLPYLLFPLSIEGVFRAQLFPCSLLSLPL